MRSATSLLGLFGLSLLLSLLLFPERVVEEWTSMPAPIPWGRYLRLSGVISAFSLCIGALGAAFEDQSYFRHVIFVDEEL